MNQITANVEIAVLRPSRRGCETFRLWRSSGEWWTGTRWARDEWNIDLSDGGIYRIYFRLGSGDWFVEGVYD